MKPSRTSPHRSEDAPDDARLIARILAGDQESYAVLVERYQGALYRFALGMVVQADAAADLVQESFIKAYVNLEQCHDPARFRAWIFRIVSNRCKDYLKSRRRQFTPLDENAPILATGEDPESGLEQHELREAIDRALAHLPRAQREAFLLKHVEGLSYEEMAESLKVSVSALKMRVFRARESLQALLQRVVC